ncbi:putative copper resistance protein D [Kribbella antiqua]|uniref:Putative copper resistance protein D n=1 Tax=Kribbella antiqua TaxID=2512217 RepID=A0A4R2ISB1_9ACTN|nr:CopD family protein [Kribbella antiqua]TCO48303.1 putative copper resistance protein D [Kribbella antiqua]
MDLTAPALKVRRPVVLSVIAGLSVAALVWAIVITRPAPEPAINTTSPGILYTTPFARFVTNGAAITATGAVLFLLLLGAAGRQKYDAVAARARVIAIAVGIAWVTATTTTWWLQAAAISGSGPKMPFAGMASYAVEVTSGTALALTVVAATAYTVLVLRRTSSYWPMACALVGLVAVPATGHASQTNAAWLTTPAICLHMCAVSLWVGGLALVTVLVARNRSALSLVLPRFSTVAGGAIATVAVTGVLLAGPRLTKDITPHPSVLLHALLETPAGWLVIGKLVGLGILAATGGFIRQFLLPAVRRQETVALATLATVELTVMAVTIAIATALARPL